VHEFLGARLLAVDLDGTLVRADGTVTAADADAIVTAQRGGIEVVLTTARFPRGCSGLAARLGCARTLICVDGALVLSNGRVLALHSLEASTVQAATLAARRGGLRVFVFGSETVHFASHDTEYLAYVEGWAQDCDPHPNGELPQQPLLWVALGCRDQVQTAFEQLAAIRDPSSELAEATASFDSFAITADCWALRLRHAAVDKGRAVLRLAGHTTQVLAVGNDYNDLSLFRIAARSFAMGDAPLDVRRAATDVLVATSHTGGGVAEALARLGGDADAQSRT
jgi:hydroxymethylpyrimidine pyrophosphatase-like HAD family hydrolase